MAPKRKRTAPHYARKKKRSRRAKGRAYSITALVPKTRRVKLCYVGSTTIGDGLLDPTVDLIANGMYDPEDAIGLDQHQPLGFDNWMAFYHHYQVYKSKVTVFIDSALAQANNRGVYLTVRVDGDTTTPTPITGSNHLEQAMEQPGTVVKFISPSDGGTSTRNNSVSKSWSLTGTFGKGAMGVTHYKGGAGTNPLEKSYFRIRACNSNMSTEQEHSMRVVFKMTFWALLSERKDLGQS